MRRIPWLRLQTCSAFANDLIFPNFLNTDIIWRYNNGTRIEFCTRVTIWSARSFCDLFMTCKSVILPVAEKTRIVSHAPLFSRIKILHIYDMERMHAKSHHIKSTHSSCMWFTPFPTVVGSTTIMSWSDYLTQASSTLTQTLTILEPNENWHLPDTYLILKYKCCRQCMMNWWVYHVEYWV